MTLQQKTSAFWWTRNIASVVYFFRELTGVLIALYVMIFLGAAVILKPESDFVDSQWFEVVSAFGLAAAIFHTITWFWVTVKISPVPLPKPIRILGFLGLLGATAAASYFLLGIVYLHD